MVQPATRRGAGLPVPTMLLIGIFLILLTAALRLGAGFLLPMTIAGLFTLLLDPPVRALGRLGLAPALGAALVVFGTLGIMGTGAGLLVRPVMEWAESAPRAMTQVQARIRRVIGPLQETARQVELATAPPTRGGPATVRVKTPGVLEQLRVRTTSLVATTLSVAFLTYFLLVMLPAFRAKFADLLGTRSGARNVEEILQQIELQMSRYVFLNMVISAGVGLATWGFLALVGVPYALLLGLVAFVCNFIPYIGAVVAVGLAAAAAVVAFDDTGQVLLVVGGCVAINALEGNLVTPLVMGRHLPLNPVAIFVSLLYWGWVWGPAGMLLAVPLTAMIQVICARIKPLHPVAALLNH